MKSFAADLMVFTTVRHCLEQIFDHSDSSEMDTSTPTHEQRQGGASESEVDTGHILPSTPGTVETLALCKLINDLVVDVLEDIPAGLAASPTSSKPYSRTPQARRPPRSSPLAGNKQRSPISVDGGAMPRQTSGRMPAPFVQDSLLLLVHMMHLCGGRWRYVTSGQLEVAPASDPYPAFGALYEQMVLHGPTALLSEPGNSVCAAATSNNAAIVFTKYVGS